MVHIIGAGLAGLAAAEALLEQGYAIRLYEATGQAGGRCRSYSDPILGCEIDNGNHILIEANEEARALLARIGAAEYWQWQGTYAFVDLKTEAQWSLRSPFWLPRLPLVQYAPLLKLLLGRMPSAGLLYKRALAPLCISALNTVPEGASARLFRGTILKALRKGAAPLVPTVSLNDALIAPLLSTLKGKTEMNYRHSLKSLEIEEGRVTLLRWAKGQTPVAEGDAVVLAVPASAAANLLSELTFPDAYEPIVNAHFAFDLPERYHSMLGVTSGAIDWVFVKPSIISTTTSAASRHEELTEEMIWADVCRALQIEAELPPCRMVTEKRATFRASDDQLNKRPTAKTPYANLVLAGDYTQTGLPATIEGAIHSGRTAAALVISGGCAISDS